jgi:threonine dehydrogenase-like Zn-dependent dehydrogenase
MQQLLPLVQSKAWPFTGIISHRMPLQQGVEAYKMFAEVGDRCEVQSLLATSFVRDLVC